MFWTTNAMNVCVRFDNLVLLEVTDISFLTDRSTRYSIIGSGKLTKTCLIHILGFSTRRVRSCQEGHLDMRHNISGSSPAKTKTKSNHCDSFFEHAYLAQGEALPDRFSRPQLRRRTRRRKALIDEDSMSDNSEEDQFTNEDLENFNNVKSQVMMDRSVWSRMVDLAGTVDVNKLPVRWLSPGTVTSMYLEYRVRCEHLKRSRVASRHSLITVIMHCVKNSTMI